ncbi:MAG: hypothetical protein ABR907_02395 [Terracidiphilus sp.]|jgi:hypothetical protein
MKIQQISLFVENKPGHIAAPARLLAEHGFGIRALYLADTQQYGIMRFIVAESQKAATLLETQGFVVKLTEVLAVEVADQPGGLADVLDALDGSGINIEYMYAFPNMCAGKAILIFRFNDSDAAIAQLQRAGINLLASDELLK